MSVDQAKSVIRARCQFNPVIGKDSVLDCYIRGAGTLSEEVFIQILSESGTLSKILQESPTIRKLVTDIETKKISQKLLDEKLDGEFKHGPYVPSEADETDESADLYTTATGKIKYADVEKYLQEHPSITASLNTNSTFNSKLFGDQKMTTYRIKPKNTEFKLMSNTFFGSPLMYGEMSYRKTRERPVRRPRKRIQSKTKSTESVKSTSTTISTTTETLDTEIKQSQDPQAQQSKIEKVEKTEKTEKVIHDQNWNPYLLSIETDSKGFKCTLIAVDINGRRFSGVCGTKQIENIDSVNISTLGNILTIKNAKLNNCIVRLKLIV